MTEGEAAGTSGARERSAASSRMSWSYASTRIGTRSGFVKGSLARAPVVDIWDSDPVSTDRTSSPVLPAGRPGSRSPRRGRPSIRRTSTWTRPIRRRFETGRMRTPRPPESVRQPDSRGSVTPRENPGDWANERTGKELDEPEPAVDAGRRRGRSEQSRVRSGRLGRVALAAGRARACGARRLGRPGGPAGGTIRRVVVRGCRNRSLTPSGASIPRVARPSSAGRARSRRIGQNRRAQGTIDD